MTDDLFGAEGLEGVDIDQLAAQLEDSSHAWPDTLAELVDVLVATFERLGRPYDAAIKDARVVVYAIARHCGGRPIYLPNGHTIDLALRAAQIYHDWSRNRPIAVLAREHGITLAGVYEIIARQRKLRFKRQQQELPL